MPYAGAGDVVITVGWATEYGKVQISLFTLKDPDPGATQPPSSSSSTSSATSYGSFDSESIVLGVVFGVGGLIFTVLVFSIYMRSASKNDQIPNENKILKFAQYASVAACALIAVVIGLVSAWVQEGSTGYLGVVDTGTTSGKLAWHAALMAGGLFSAQALAVLCWTLLHTHAVAKVAHVLFHTAGLVTLSLGLASIVSYKHDRQTPALTSVHSWVGVAAVAMFLLNYVYGVCMGLLTLLHPTATAHKAVDLRGLHRVIGFCSVGLSAIAIATGVMNVLPIGLCYYTTTFDQPDLNPSHNYYMLPDGCKIGNGLVITILAAVMCLLAAVYMRHVSIMAKQ
jgi:hypothetical protein